ncbi:hypothetical protein ABS71_05550 [bacterium SCN 62-11]|nr:MAG: hypothetical protein ABS71_05550 [bacterium SCN 62-11]
MAQEPKLGVAAFGLASMPLLSETLSLGVLTGAEDLGALCGFLTGADDLLLLVEVVLLVLLLGLELTFIALSSLPVDSFSVLVGASRRLNGVLTACGSCCRFMNFVTGFVLRCSLRLLGPERGWWKTPGVSAPDPCAEIQAGRGPQVFPSFPFRESATANWAQRNLSSCPV